MPKDLLSLKDYAELIGKPARALYYLYRSGRLDDIVVVIFNEIYIDLTKTNHHVTTTTGE